MKAVHLEKAGGPLVLRTVHVPRPQKGEVLVKMSAAPVNPSDLHRIRSVEEDNISAFIPGIEGSGTVVLTGEGLLPRLWSGRRVACSSVHPESGTWAEYMVTSASYCFPLPKGVSDEQGSMLLVNPMTALAFLDMIINEKHKAVISPAASGALGGMIRYLGKKYSIPVINVVRNEQQVTLLKEGGAEYILNSRDHEFPDQLKLLSHELSATLALDPVSGSFTQLLLDAIPYGGTVVLYGNLSAEEQGINLRPLLTDNKKVHGFYLGNWMKENGILKTVQNLIRVRKLLENEVKIKVHERFPLEKVQTAIDTYLNNMTAGKVLLVPGNSNELTKD